MSLKLTCCLIGQFELPFHIRVTTNMPSTVCPYVEVVYVVQHIYRNYGVAQCE